jgi:two-component system, cell cycle sensor histidine kinase and response regulator CckA
MNKPIREKTIGRFVFGATALLATLLVLGLAFFFISRQYRAYLEECRMLETRWMEAAKERLRNEVHRALGQARREMDRMDQDIRAELRERTLKAKAVARGILDQTRDRLSREDIQVLVRETLRDIRFNRERGYYFIDHIDGTCVLLPIAPWREGADFWDNRDDTGHYVMRDFIRIVLEEGEGFSSYRWYAPGDSEAMRDKVSFVTFFEPFEWIIGAGEYLDDAASRIQEALLEHFGEIRFGDSGNLSILRGDGTILVLPAAPGLVGKNALELPDASMRERARTLLSIGARGGGFSSDMGLDPGRSRSGPDLTYVERLPEWDWIVVAGIETDAMEATLIGQRESLTARIRREIGASAMMLLFAIGVALAIARVSSRKAGRIFREYATESDRFERERLRFRSAVEHASESIFILDPGGRIVYVNPAFREVSGYSAEEALGKTPAFLGSGNGADEFHRNFPTDLSGERPWRGRLTLRRKDGGLFHADASVSPVRDAEGRLAHFVSIQRDVTHEVKLERELRQAHKMEAIGTLAGGIAHDFNNILFPILGYTEMTMDEVPEGSEAEANLREIRRAVNRARDLIAQILTFGRMDRRERRPLRLEPIVKESLKLLRASIPTTIAIESDLDPDAGPVLADPTRIQQVLINLCTNAYHAMRDRGGRMTIGLRAAGAGAGVPAPDSLPPGRYVRLSVTDTGVGMAPEVARKIFEPYFTTREAGEGTGMGLAMVHGIVRDLGGEIAVRSRPGAGSSFRIWLPVIDRDDPPEPEPAPTPAPRGAERILLVDDERTIVEMIRQMLTRLGYAVVPTTDPREALAAFRNDPDAFDLLITDMTMPGRTGAELAREVRAIRPGFPVILCTGYSEAISETSAQAAGIAEFLLKPVGKDDLAVAVRRALAGADEAPPIPEEPSDAL